MNVSMIASSVGAAASARDLSAFSERETSSTNSAADRKKVSAQFEAVLVRQLLSKSVGSLLGGSDNVAGSVYGDMMTDVLAQQLTAGQGLGLGRMIEKQLTPRGVPADQLEDQKNAAPKTPEPIKALP